MPPDDGGGPPEGSKARKVGEIDRRQVRQTATDDPFAHLLSDIVGHPEQLPSVEELAFMNPAMSSDAIRQHLERLISIGIVEERELPPGERRPDYPDRFYTLSQQAREVFNDANLYPREPWHREYAAVEKSDRIAELEAGPRPER